MVNIIHCEYCNGTDTPLDGVSVRVTLTKAAPCNQCHRTEFKEQSHYFCSIDCFKNYMDDVSSCISDKTIEWKN